MVKAPPKSPSLELKAYPTAEVSRNNLIAITHVSYAVAKL